MVDKMQLDPESITNRILMRISQKVNRKGFVGMAKAKQLPSGMWRIQPHKTIDGKYYRTSITAPTRKEAERLAANWEVEQDIQEKQKESLKAVFESYIKTCKAQGLSSSTIVDYQSRSKNSFPDLIDKYFFDITTVDLQEQIDSRSESVSPKTIRNDISFFRAACSSRNRYIDFSKLKIAKKKRRRKMEMKQEWKVSIPKKVAELYGKDDYYLYIILIIYAGLRPSESYALTWSDLSKEPIEIDGVQIGYIDITKARVKSEDGFKEKSTKTDSGIRRVVVSWSLIREILSVKDRGNDDERIIELNPYYDGRKWEKIKEEFNLPPKMRRYDLRHFFATQLVISGATEEELQEQMGHATSYFSHSIYVEIMKEHKEMSTTNFAKTSQTSIDELASVPINKKA